MANFHVGDYGSVIELTIVEGKSPVDISGFSGLKIIFTKPKQKGNITRNAIFTTDGVDGKMRYTWVSGDLDTAGEWQFQAMISKNNAGFYSEIGAFTVDKGLVS